AAERELADVVVGVPKRAKEDLLRLLQHEDRIYAVDLNIPIDQRPHAVIVANGDRQPKLLISHYLFSLLGNNRNESVSTSQPRVPGGRLDRNRVILYRMILLSITCVKNHGRSLPVSFSRLWVDAQHPARSCAPLP